VEITYLYEQYPEDRCYNGGVLLNQTQRYYICEQLFDNHLSFRVDSFTYNKLITEHPDYYSCS